MDLKQQGGCNWTGVIWLRIDTNGGLLWPRQWTFGFHTRRGISWPAEEPSASPEGHNPVELVPLSADSFRAQLTLHFDTWHTNLSNSTEPYDGAQ